MAALAARPGLLGIRFIANVRSLRAFGGGGSRYRGEGRSQKGERRRPTAAETYAVLQRGVLPIQHVHLAEVTFAPALRAVLVTEYPAPGHAAPRGSQQRGSRRALVRAA